MVCLRYLRVDANRGSDDHGQKYEDIHYLIFFENSLSRNKKTITKKKTLICVSDES